MAAAEVELSHLDIGFDRLGGKVFTRDIHPDTEKKCETLRKKAREEVDKRKDCMRRAHEAYERGDGATAKQLSNEGKRHAARADEYFKEASDMIFSANNPEIAADTIDLHGLYVVEAERRVEERIQADQRAGKTHLHIIVGKGIHSVDHVQKIKPAIEKLCQDLGLQYATEENEGRIYVNLQGDDVTHMPPPPPNYGGHQQHYGDQPHYYPGQQGPHYGGQHHGGQSQQQGAPYYPGQQGQHYGGQNQQEEENDDIERLVTRLFKKYCCTVM
ncbi:DUF1771-domain-containing protein [Xylaria sp. FL0933]|nr:DUF1771-domain-containing protein [Xylaria sp. FL0933]